MYFSSIDSLYNAYTYIKFEINTILDTIKKYGQHHVYASIILYSL